MYKVPQDVLIQGISEELKAKIKMPSWALFVKTGMHKERPKNPKRKPSLQKQLSAAIKKGKSTDITSLLFLGVNVKPKKNKKSHPFTKQPFLAKLKR